MNEDNAPVTIDDFLVAPEEEGSAQDGLQGDTQAGEQAEPSSADTRSAEEKLIDELAQDGDEGEDDEGEAGNDVPPPPHSWGKEDAEAWKNAPQEIRDVVARREGERDKFISDLGRKSADQRREIERQAMEAVAQQAESHAQQLEAYMRMNMPGEPNAQLLYTGNPDDVVIYQRQDAAYRAGLAQQQELQQRIALSQQQASAAREQSAQAYNQAEAQRLQETVPEFYDPEAGPKFRQRLESIGQELGYPPELMAQAGATDILALKQAAEWRDDAMKYRKIVAKRMETVRSAKGLPKMSRPQAATGPVAAQAASAEREQAAISQFNRDRSADAAAALLMTRTK